MSTNDPKIPEFDSEGFVLDEKTLPDAQVTDSVQFPEWERYYGIYNYMFECLPKNNQSYTRKNLDQIVDIMRELYSLDVVKYAPIKLKDL